MSEKTEEGSDSYGTLNNGSDSPASETTKAKTKQEKKTNLKKFC